MALVGELAYTDGTIEFEHAVPYIARLCGSKLSYSGVYKPCMSAIVPST